MRTNQWVTGGAKEGYTLTLTGADKIEKEEDKILTFDDFFERQSRFQGLSNNDQILYAAWYLQEVMKVDRFSAPAINALFRELHIPLPPTATYLPRLASAKPPKIMRRGNGYVLEGKTKRALSEKLSDHPSVVLISSMLIEATSRVTDPIEEIYLNETIRCYRAGAFRATIVMMWNLCFDHMRRWVFADKVRLAAFNEGLSKRYPKLQMNMQNPEQLDELKESQVLDGLQTSGLISKNIDHILREKLRKRNAAAHPSAIVIAQAQADEVIIDLIQNVISRYLIS